MSASALPRTMRALLHTQSTQSFSLSPNQPIPTPASDEYLLKVSATAITNGELIWPRPLQLNISHPGVEASGIIVSVPTSIAQPKFHPGDKVYFRTTYPNPGSAREYSTAKESELALRPQNLSAIEAAAVPVAALTAWQGLFVQAILPLPQSTTPNPTTSPIRILINGASTSTGLFFLQLATLLLTNPYTLTATCSPKNATLVSSLGAHHIIDYTTTPLPPNSYDLIFSCAPITPAVWKSLAAYGRLYTIVAPFDVAKLEEWKFDLDTPDGCEEGVKGKFYIMESKGEDLDKVTKLIEEGKIKVLVDSVWQLEEWEGAFAKVGTGRAVGKVVLKIAEEEQ